MWTVLFMLTATVGGQRQDALFTTHLDGAMVGFDPSCMNGLHRPNTGTKSMILQPLKTPLSTLTDALTPNHFINEAEELKCIPELTVQTVKSYKDYRDLAATSAFQFSSDTNLATTSLRYDNNASCGNKNNRRDQELLQFFNSTDGEIVFASAECVTHTITITPFEPVAFTPTFETALVSLYKAAVNSGSEATDKTFSDFISSYGTHFSIRTQLGAKVLMGKAFSNGSVTAGDEATRRRCVLQAAHKVLTPGTRMRHETTHMQFDREAGESCGGTGHEVIVSISGPLPDVSLENWASAAEELPDPIFYYLEPISTLLTREWVSSHAETAKIDKSILHQYFVNRLSNYTATLAGVSRQPASEGSAPKSCCEPGHVCLDETDSGPGYRCVSSSDSTTPPDTDSAAPPVASTTAPPKMTSTTAAAHFVTGGPFIIGGVGVTIFSETLGAPDSSSFPGLVYGNAAVNSGTTVYSCGGQGKYERACYFLSAQDQTWRSTALPWPLISPSAVMAQDQVIWFLQDSNLYTFNTAKDRGQFREYRLSFPFSVHFCAVSNRSHTFAVGVGLDFDEVWVNKNTSRPTKWEKVTNLLEGRRGHACLWLGSNIFVTGGRDGDYNGIDSAEVIDVENMISRSLSPMVYSREDHQMAVLHGKPAALGGYSSRVPTDSIEVFDASLNEWQTLDYKMKDKRAKFGLAQYRL